MSEEWSTGGGERHRQNKTNEKKTGKKYNNNTSISTSQIYSSLPCSYLFREKCYVHKTREHKKKLVKYNFSCMPYLRIVFKRAN